MNGASDTRKRAKWALIHFSPTNALIHFSPMNGASDTRKRFKRCQDETRKCSTARRRQHKRKAGDEDLDVAVIADGPKSPPLSRSRQKRKKKFQSTDEDKVRTRTILVKAASDKDLNLAGIDSAADDRNVREEETWVRTLRYTARVADIAEIL
ncbi:uncharacterized protein F5891DRAFT_981984 [Suillus fuscotomentosus]|uniref:Uncharacterized protein n=1 Tax=Suillus fuscotomentosus TaxID=1912939 RepID=A0AAD4HJ23_9AGAM|nr:uncharacterized protein F5891DRAFT_981984 [Suillus fuscotomentosus]KAG1898347.1 hypothetical protein F5891DRAFT_981984 [Suillus fuscotomentosus]